MSNERKTASASMYVSLNNNNMNKECPGSTYDRTRDISIMILENSESKDEFYLKDITYMTLDDAYQKYIIENCNVYPSPFDHIKVAYSDILKSRILSQRKYSLIDYSNHSKDKNEYFLKYCQNTLSDDERIYLDNIMHFDDHLIDWTLSSDLHLRDKAMTVIKSSPVGSWLVRRSSIKEQEHVKIRVITCRSKNEEIRNYLLAHINGFGYILTDGLQGSSMPSLGESKTIKVIVSFYSLPDLFDYMKTKGIELNRIVKEI